METKKILGIIMAVVVVVGGSLGGYFIWKYYPQSVDEPRWYPDTPIPAANLTFIKSGEDNVVVTLEEFVNYIDNGTIPKVQYNETINEAEVTLIGFDPVTFYTVIGWHDAFDVSFIASDAYSKTINATDFMAQDPEYNSGASGYIAMICIVADDQWARDFDATWGDFAIRGFDSGSKKVRDVVSLEYESPWQIGVEVNGTIEFYLDSTNITTALAIGWNYTTYDYGYFDEALGYGWDVTSHSGFTVNSVIQYCLDENIGGMTGLTDYNVSILAFDGWGWKWQYNATDVEEGLSPEHSATMVVNNETVIIPNEGKQMMIADNIGGTPLNHAEGPYRVIIPGQSKRQYTRGILTIQIFFND